MTTWLAVLYVVLLPIGRASLPLNAQWGDLVLPLLALSAARDHPLGRWLRSGDWPLAFYLLATLLAAAFSSEPSLGLVQLLKQASVASIFLVFRQLRGAPERPRLLARAYVIPLALLTLLSIIGVFLSPRPGSGMAAFGAADVLPFLGLVRRVRGAFITPEMFGNALVVAFPLALGLRAAGTERSRKLWTAMASVFLAGELLTFSHSLAGFVMAAVLFATPSMPGRSARLVAWCAAALVFAAVNAASFVEPGAPANDYGVGPASYEVMGVKIEGQLNHYAALKQVAWSAFLAQPLTGVGPGRFPEATEKAFQGGSLNRRYRNKVAQCDLLGRLAETGLFGGVSLMLLWANWLTQGRSWSSGSALSRAAFAALVGLLVNSVNADVMNFRFLWLALAWIDPPADA